jgi:CTP:molybdopterin cytidylyltransferase MocA
MTAGLIQARRNEAAIYWIVKHGIKMTGMPAFGPSHKEEDLWSIAALAKDMPQINSKHYRHLVKEFSTEKENIRSNHERVGHHH